MPCGKRPLVKKWEKHKDARVITPSRYEQNEASVKAHWKKVIRDLELSYKDDQVNLYQHGYHKMAAIQLVGHLVIAVGPFWESQRNTVQELVGPTIFRRLAQMFKLPPDAKDYEPQSETASLQASGFFYTLGSDEHLQKGDAPYSLSDFEPSVEEESSVEEEELENWSTTTSKDASLDNRPSHYQSLMKAKSSMSKAFTSKFTVSRLSTSKSLKKSSSRLKRFSQIQDYAESLALTDDDLIVQKSRKSSRKMPSTKTLKNPHFDMLYCNESETDMIKWNSKYKQKGFEISASDEFSKKAEILTKLISKEFYDWWVGLGNVEFKSEIKRPEDIEDLFQVLFDEHASRALVLDPKILPCVLPSIAKFVGVPKAACPSVLKRQIAFDILAETSPAHKEAFGTCLPQRMKHIPPNNDTEKMWHSLVIPEDLKSMAAVWDDIAHLTSTKAFHSWLQKRPHLPMAKFLKSMETPGEKKQAFVVPSDYVLAKEGSSGSVQELALPVSEFTLELKEVLDVIMND